MLKVSGVFEAQTNSTGSGVNTISKLILHPYKSQCMISISHDGLIKLWNLKTLKQMSRKQIKTPYLTSIIPFKDGFLLGAGSGRLIDLSRQFQIRKQYQIHDDCLTDIIQLDNFVVTTGFDGTVAFLNKETLRKQKEISCETPLHKIIFFNESLYLAGTPSYHLDLMSFQLKELRNYQNFIVFQDQIFGCSEDSGLTRLRNNDRTFQPCQFAYPLRNMIMMFSGESLGFLALQDVEEDMNWRVQKIPNIEKHFSISACLQYNEDLILASQSSKIIKIQLTTDNESS